MKILKSIIRMCLICALAVPFLWFGFKYGGPVKPAYGEIFRELSGPLLLHFRQVGSNASRDSWRTLRVNKNSIYYKVGKGEGSIPALFDVLERSVTSAEKSELKPIGAKESGRQNAAFESAVAIRLFRHEWADWGALGFIVEDGSKAQSREFPQNLKSHGNGRTELPYEGSIVAFIAYLNPDDRSSTYLTFWFDDSFDYQALLPTAGGDAPGRDAPGIPRYPGLKRSYTFEEIGDAFESVMAVYLGNGNYHSVAEFYRSLMIGRGWEPREISTAGAGRRSERMLFFARSGAECTLYTTSPKPGVVQAIVSLRLAKAEG